jgi:Prokaryotic E2 family E/Multiubiquitin
MAHEEHSKEIAAIEGRIADGALQNAGSKVEVVEEVLVDDELVELVVIEEFAKRGEKPPRAKTYLVRIDKKTYHIHKPDPAGEELLEAAGKTSAGFKLYQIFRGRQPEPVAPNQHVDLRRDFTLPEVDISSLDAMKLGWSTVREPSGALLLVIEGWRLPAGYNVATATLVLAIPQGYPDTQIDMAYFSPPLIRADGRAINNLTTAAFSIGTFQQWSRHRTAQNPWRPGADDISTHLSLVDDWLRREFERR